MSFLRGKLMHSSDALDTRYLEKTLDALYAIEDIQPHQEVHVRQAVKACFESIGESYPEYLEEHHGEMLLFISQEAVSDKLKAAWGKIEKGWSSANDKTKKAISWYNTDGKGLIAITKKKFGLLKDSRDQLRDVEVDGDTALLLKEGSELKGIFEDLVEQDYDNYAEDRTEMGRMIRRLRPGSKLGTSVASFETQQANVHINSLDTRVDELRKELKRIKAKARDVQPNPVPVSSVLRELDTFSSWVEEISEFVKVIEKNQKRWTEDAERLERILDNEETDIKGAEEFLRLVALDRSSKLLRLCNTLIHFTSSNVSKAHKKLTEQ